MKLRHFIVAVWLALACATSFVGTAFAQVANPTSLCSGAECDFDNNTHTQLDATSISLTNGDGVVGCNTVGINGTATFDTVSVSGVTIAGLEILEASGPVGTNNVRAVLFFFRATSTGTATISPIWMAPGVARGEIFLDKVTGFDTSDPIRQSNDATAASDDEVTGTLGLAPLATSVVLACGIGADDNFSFNTARPQSGWTELDEKGTAGDRKPTTQWIDGGDMGSGTFGINFGDGGTPFNADLGVAIAAMEIQAPAASSGLLLRRRRH